MALNCPSCGAHLSIVLAGDSTSRLDQVSTPDSDSANTPAPPVPDDATSPPQRTLPGENPTETNPQEAKPENPKSKTTNTTGEEPEGHEPTLPEQPNQKQPSPNKPKAKPKLPDFTLTDFKRFQAVMCAPPTGPRKPKHATFRLALPPEAGPGALTDARSRTVLDTTAFLMMQTLTRAAEKHRSVDALLAARRGGRAEHELPGRMELVVEVLGAIAYDMHWSRGEEEGWIRHFRVLLAKNAPTLAATGPTWRTLRDVFELMLAVDYGFPAYPLAGWSDGPKSPRIHQLAEVEYLSFDLTVAASSWLTGREIPPADLWNRIARVAKGWESMPLGLPAWDIAVLLWYYNSRGKPVSSKEHEQGWTGYTGVLQDMISEVPTRGTARLERKLSLDVHVLIPQCVRDRRRRRQMISTAQGLAVEYGCELAPIVESATPGWRTWLGSFASHLRFSMRVDDDEKGDDKQRLLGGIEEEQGADMELENEELSCCWTT